MMTTARLKAGALMIMRRGMTWRLMRMPAWQCTGNTTHAGLANLMRFGIAA